MTGITGCRCWYHDGWDTQIYGCIYHIDTGQYDERNPSTNDKLLQFDFKHNKFFLLIIYAPQCWPYDQTLFQ